LFGENIIKTSIERTQGYVTVHPINVVLA